MTTPTPKALEFARKVYDSWTEIDDVPSNRIVEDIAHAIDAARREGYQKAIESCAVDAASYAKGAAWMRDAAAKVANYFETEDGDTDEVMAYAIKAEKRIRSLTPPESRAADAANTPKEGK